MSRAWPAFLLAVLIGAPAALAAEETAPLPPGALGEIVKRLPAQDAAAAADLSRELLKGGAETVKTLVALLAEPGKVDDSKIRYAIHGMAIYAARGGDDDSRKMVADALVAALADAERPPLVKAFLIQQLRFCAAKEACEPLGKFLLDEKLCEDATQTLLSISGEEAAAVLRAALPQAKGACRLTLVQALGLLRDAKSAEEIAKSAKDADRDLRLAALSALANLGDPAWTELLTKAASVEPAYERSQATNSLLTQARRLIEGGRQADAEKICRALYTDRTAPDERAVRCAALRGLAGSLGAKATSDLAAALASDDVELRTMAADAAAAIPGEDVTRQWIDKLKGASPTFEAEVLDILARRGDRAALQPVFFAMRDAAKSVEEAAAKAAAEAGKPGAADAAKALKAAQEVRVAAIRAVAAIGRKEAVPSLLTILAGKDLGDHAAARDALVHIPGAETSAALATALPVVTKEARAATLGILAARGDQAHLAAVLACIADKEEGVRVAALDAAGALADDKAIPQLLDVLLKTPSEPERAAAERAVEMLARRSQARDKVAGTLLAALPAAGPEARCALLRVLGGTGSAKALEPLRAALKDKDPKVQDAVVRALGKWPDASVAPDLLAVAKAAEKGTLHVLAFRGYLDVLRQPNKRTPEDSLRNYEDAMAIATSHDEKKSVLGALGDIKAIGVLKLAVPCLEVEALRPEAEAAVLRVAERFWNVKEIGARTDLQDALQKVIENTKNEGRHKEAQRRLDALKK